MKSSHRSVVLLLLGLVVGCAACLLFSSLGYQRGYRAALDHQKAQLFITIDALEQVHDGNVDGATRLSEEACFQLANRFLEREQYQSDPDMLTLMPRLTKYWDTYCADRTKRTSMEERFGRLLAQRR